MKTIHYIITGPNDVILGHLLITEFMWIRLQSCHILGFAGKGRMVDIFPLNKDLDIIRVELFKKYQIPLDLHLKKFDTSELD
ncbi:MAG: hypothetical protein ACK4ND_08595 [Cytophagaceae bacterium]